MIADKKWIHLAAIKPETTVVRSVNLTVWREPGVKPSEWTMSQATYCRVLYLPCVLHHLITDSAGAILRYRFRDDL